MLLSILTPTLPSRAKYLSRLREQLTPQMNDQVEHLILGDRGEMTTGEKRQQLVERAKGRYVAHFDDDDIPSEDYVRLILEAIEPEPDVVGIRGYMTIDGLADSAHPFEHSIRHDRWYAKDGKYFRCPSPINPVRRDLSLKVPYLPLTYKEDFAWSVAMQAAGLLKTETFIGEPIYLYEFRTSAKRDD